MGRLKKTSVAQKSSVAVVCTTKTGYPDTQPTARLLWENGTEMKPVVQHDDLHVTHVIQHIDCDDMGSVTCEIEEAGVNESIPLLVKCELSALTYS